MCNHCSNQPNDEKLTLGATGLIVGALLGALYYGATLLPKPAVEALVGGMLGTAVAVFWPTLSKFVRQITSSEWAPSEISLEPSKLFSMKLVVNNAQRRAAMQVFAQMSTRITLRRIADNAGDDGEAITSVYEFLKASRAVIASLDYDLPQNGDTVETYVLEMINKVLAPFLEKWHLEWETWKAAQITASQSVATSGWPQHLPFRNELRQLQDDLKPIAKGLAKAAGIANPEDRFPILK